jgi:nucleotide-binding universal stress UspA family protein
MSAVSTVPPRPGSVVVGVDGSSVSDRAIDWAVDQARRQHLPLHLLHAYVRDSPPMHILGRPGAVAPVEPAQVAEVVLARAVRRAVADLPGVAVTGSVHEGSAAGHLVDASRQAGSIVVGSDGDGGLAHLLLGSTASQVASHAHCPVTVVRPTVVGPTGVRSTGDPAAGAARPVVVGVDPDGSDDAVELAFAEADRRGAPLVGVHAWWYMPSDSATAEIAAIAAAALDQALAGWADKYPDVVIRPHLVHGDPVDELVNASSGAALLVVGSRGRGGFAALLLGSVSQHLLQLAHCPVTVVPHHGHRP